MIFVKHRPTHALPPPVSLLFYISSSLVEVVIVSNRSGLHLDCICSGILLYLACFPPVRVATPAHAHKGRFVRGASQLYSSTL